MNMLQIPVHSKTQLLDNLSPSEVGDMPQAVHLKSANLLL